MKTFLQNRLQTIKRKRQLAMVVLSLAMGTVAFAQKPCPPNKVQICHKGKVVICVSPSAVAAHLAHGDKLGDCNPVVPPCSVNAAGGTINCANPSVTLQAQSTNTGASYSWNGPNGFTSTAASPVVSVPGIYTVTVSSPNCNSVSDTAVVTRDLTAPVVTATGGTISCNQPSVTLTAQSSVEGSLISWTGPNGFNSNEASPVVTMPGTYVVTATHPVTGCTATNAAVVQQNISAPAILTIEASGSGTITCTHPSVVLTATTNAANVSYQWTGPDNYVSNEPAPAVTQPGTYHLVLSDTDNGCTSSASIEVQENTTAPTDVNTIPAVLGRLSCAAPSLVLTGGSATPGVSYQWTGPNGFSSSSSSATATAPGLYTLMVTDTSNGCGSQAMVTVEQDMATPAGVTASNSEPLTCFTTEVTLMGGASTEAVSYQWSGPDGFSSISPVTTTSVPGVYTLTVTDLNNGCTSTASTTVEQNITPPAGLNIQSSGVLSCNNLSVTLEASSSTAEVDYNWFGPDGYFAATAAIVVETPGEYLLMATDRVNGCSEFLTATVEQDLSDCILESARSQGRELSAEQNHDGEVTFSVQPNPVRGNSVVSFKIPQNAKANLVIYHTSGGGAQVLFDQQAQANQLYRLPLNGTKLSKGMYFCVLTVNGKQYSKKIVVMP